VRDALAATLAMLLITGAKSSALTMVPPLMLVTYGRLLLAQGKARRGAALAVIGGGSAAIVGMGALTFARNWLAFRNPVWPVTFSEPRLGLQWRGLVTLQKLTPSKSLGVMLAQKYGHPVPGIADILARDYGYGVPWVVLPLALLALVAALIVALRRRRAGRPDAPTENLLLLAALGAVLLAGTPNASSARYNVHLVAVLVVAIAWAAGKMREAARFHEGAVAGTLLLTLVPMVWTGWFFGVDGKGITALLRRSHAERASSYAGDFHLSPEVARARDRELGPGDLVIFTQETLFIGALWNDQLSNRVEYLERRDTHDFLDEIEKRHARWVVVGGPSALRAALMAPNSGWELVGPAGAPDKMVAFRKR
jgi:hypothetical protein